MKSFKDYDINNKTGFLINQDEYVQLPDYYNPWIELKRNLETLMKERHLCQYVDEMPLLSTEFLKTDNQRRYCRCLLAISTTAFVWHDRKFNIPKILPKSLAVPFRILSDHFGLMPIICHTDMVLINTIIDTTKESNSNDFLRIKEQIINNYNWTVFQRETARIEYIFAPIISIIEDINMSIVNTKILQVISSLQRIHDIVIEMKSSMQNFKEMDPDFFHLEMRPFLVGWSGDSFPYSNGLLYQNEDGTNTPIECIGASAAQSATLQTLDTLFKIEHSEDNQKFFDTMKTYMLKGHRDFIADIRRYIKLEDFVHENSDNQTLVTSYNNCLSAISMFRTNHMQTVTKFIINPAKKVLKCEDKSEFLQEKGTGGQDLLMFLKEVRDDTNNNLIIK